MPKTTDALEILRTSEQLIAMGMWKEAEEAFGGLQSTLDSSDPDFEAVVKKAQFVLTFAKANREHLRDSVRRVRAGGKFLTKD